jgi:hypothetical protein
MAKVEWSAGIDHVSGALSKPSKNGQHSCAKMLLGTHRVAATTSNACNRLFLRKKVKRSTPPSAEELAQREKFASIARAVNLRAKDLSKINADIAAFKAQKDQPGGKPTMKSWYWMVCGEEYENAQG